MDNIAPSFRLLANSQDITDAIAAHFSSLLLTDAAGVDADLLEVVLDDDPTAPIALPPRGAELELFLGYDGSAQRMGLFVCDEIELSGGPPRRMTLRARASIQAETPAGKVQLTTQKTRSWDQGTTIGAMVAKMANEHGMTAAVSKSLRSVALPHTDQTEESDIHLLIRLAKRYDAVAKPAGGKLVFAARGESVSISGEALPNVTVKPADVEPGWSVVMASRESPGTVVAFWHGVANAARQLVSVGDGEPTRRLRNWFPDAASAKAAAEAELRRRQRGEHKLSLTMVGRTDVLAEAVLTLAEFRDGVDGDWLVAKVEHAVDASGYRLRVEGELAPA